MPTPASIRFDDSVAERLASYVSRHPGASRSSVAARFVDEGLRMDEHPGIVFRDGPAGRRAALVNGPDVWEVIRDVTAIRAAEPTLDEAELFTLLSENTGLSPALTRSALRYWAAFPAEVEAFVELSTRAEDEVARASERTASLLEP